MSAISCDLCVIGAGSAGLTLAAGAAQLGRRVVLIEKGEMGGDCLNTGCVPSKALIAAAARAQGARSALPFGVNCGEPDIDFAAAVDRVHAVIAAIAPHDSQERFEKLGVIVIREPAAFVSPRTVKAGGHEIRAKHFVIATGSSPAVPPIEGFGAVPYFTNETIFKNRARPEHLVVLGGGPIGVELAQAHRRLGSRVTIVEAETLLNREDPEAVDIVRAALAKEGVVVKEGEKAARVDADKGAVRLTLANGETIAGSHLLVATGRKANLDDLGLEAAGVERQARGALKLNSRLRTTNRRIFAIGDAAGGPQFTHLAADHASTVIRNVLFKAPARRRDHLAPRVTFSDPELAAVGVTEAVGGSRLLRWPFAQNDRALAEGDAEGFVKAIVARSGRILGATIVGAGAGDEIGVWSLAVANRLKISAFTRYIAPYPTRGEASKRAGGAFFTPALFSDRTRTIVRLLSALD